MTWECSCVLVKYVQKLCFLEWNLLSSQIIVIHKRILLQREYLYSSTCIHVWIIPSFIPVLWWMSRHRCLCETPHQLSPWLLGVVSPRGQSAGRGRKSPGDRPQPRITALGWTRDRRSRGSCWGQGRTLARPIVTRWRRQLGWVGQCCLVQSKGHSIVMGGKKKQNTQEYMLMKRIVTTLSTTKCTVTAKNNIKQTSTITGTVT